MGSLQVMLRENHKCDPRKGNIDALEDGGSIPQGYSTGNPLTRCALEQHEPEGRRFISLPAVRQPDYDRTREIALSLESV